MPFSTSHRIRLYLEHGRQPDPVLAPGWHPHHRQSRSQALNKHYCDGTIIVRHAAECALPVEHAQKYPPLHSIYPQHTAPTKRHPCLIKANALRITKTVQCALPEERALQHPPFHSIHPQQTGPRCITLAVCQYPQRLRAMRIKHRIGHGVSDRPKGCAPYEVNTYWACQQTPQCVTWQPGIPPKGCGQRGSNTGTVLGFRCQITPRVAPM